MADIVSVPACASSRSKPKDADIGLTNRLAWICWEPPMVQQKILKTELGEGEKLSAIQAILTPRKGLHRTARRKQASIAGKMASGQGHSEA